MQRTEANELGGAASCRAGVPVLLPQIIEQRLVLFEFFDVLVHGYCSRPEPSVGELCQHSQARMVGGRRYFSLRDARAREFAQSELAKTKAKLAARADRCLPASEPRGQAFGAERKGPVGQDSNRSTSGEVWKDPACD